MRYPKCRGLFGKSDLVNEGSWDDKGDRESDGNFRLYRRLDERGYRWLAGDEVSEGDSRRLIDDLEHI
jgi:hypothetical protein